MKPTIELAKNHLFTHKRTYIISCGVAVIVATLAILYFFTNPPKVTYKAQDACALFTPAKAQELLGDHVINVNTDKIAYSGNVATSKCSYTDSNPDQSLMKVAAVAIRSGTNEGGIVQNKSDFTNAKAQSGTQPVANIGNDAFFNPNRGQLNILSDRMWIIVSNGIGATPQSNSLNDDMTLARKVLSN